MLKLERRKAMAWRLLPHEGSDSILGMNKINLTCTLVWGVISSIHWAAYWIYHGAYAGKSASEATCTRWEEKEQMCVRGGITFLRGASRACW